MLKRLIRVVADIPLVIDQQAMQLSLSLKLHNYSAQWA